MTDPDGEPLARDTPDSTDQETTRAKLSRRQMLALPILASAPNLTEAAKEAGISEATLRRWRRDEHFRAEMDRLTHEIAETTHRGLKDLLTQSFRVVSELMEHPDPMVRFRAARAAIMYGIQVCKAEDMRREYKTPCESSSGRPEEGKEPEANAG